MKVLVIGSGGREHALVWKIAQSDNVEKIWAAPGNGGTATENKTENLPMGAAPESEQGQETLLEFVKKEKIDLTVVGPETPLAAGIVDKFRNAGMAIIGPDKKSALLESSKVFSNTFMNRYGVRTAKRTIFDNAMDAETFAADHFSQKQKTGSAVSPLVIKADGLAAGKGVVIAQTLEQARETISSFMKEGTLGVAGKNLAFEEFLQGREVSVIAAVSVMAQAPSEFSANNAKAVIRPFVSARDHKSRFEGGKGPNTGGMGAIAPVPDFTPQLQKDFENAILQPTLKGMIAEKMDYRGFIFFGLMIKDEQCYLLEYNVRFGDPEAQVVLPLMDFDFSALCFSILDGTLSSFDLKWKNEHACAPVAVASGYPESYRKGDRITFDSENLEQSGANVFIAGAQRTGNDPLNPQLCTSGGRVLAISALGKDGKDAHKKAYNALNYINFEGMAYRKDIGLNN